MSNRIATGETLVLPFAVGLLIGGIVTGWIISIPLGHGTELVGLAVSDGLSAFQLWLMVLSFTVAVGSLLHLVVLKALSALAPFPLSPRLSPVMLVVLGIVAASASSVASCLTLHSALAKYLGSPKGPSPLFGTFVSAVCVITPLLMVTRAKPRPDQSEGGRVAQSPAIGQERQTLAMVALMFLGASIGAALLMLVNLQHAGELQRFNVVADIIIGGGLGCLVGFGMATSKIRFPIVALLIGATVPHTVFAFEALSMLVTAIGGAVGWTIGRFIEKWRTEPGRDGKPANRVAGH